MQDPPSSHLLTKEEFWSLHHYLTWKESRGTVQAYQAHTSNLEEISRVNILSLWSVHKLAKSLVHAETTQIDICKNSCIAYIGAYKDCTSCPYIRDKIKAPCGVPHFSSHRRPQAQMLYIPFLTTLHALFANVTTAQELHYCDSYLKQTLALLAQGSAIASSCTYSDFCDLKVHIHHHGNMKLFDKP